MVVLVGVGGFFDVEVVVVVVEARFLAISRIIFRFLGSCLIRADTSFAAMSAIGASYKNKMRWWLTLVEVHSDLKVSKRTSVSMTKSPRGIHSVGVLINLSNFFRAVVAALEEAYVVVFVVVGVVIPPLLEECRRDRVMGVLVEDGVRDECSEGTLWVVVWGISIAIRI